MKYRDESKENPEGLPLRLNYYVKLGIASRAQFKRWEQSGRLKFLRVGRCVFIEPAELTRFIREEAEIETSDERNN